jgi:hypothetical protein
VLLNGDSKRARRTSSRRPEDYVLGDFDTCGKIIVHKGLILRTRPHLQLRDDGRHGVSDFSLEDDGDNELGCDYTYASPSSDDQEPWARRSLRAWCPVTTRSRRRIRWRHAALRLQRLTPGRKRRRNGLSACSWLDIGHGSDDPHRRTRRVECLYREQAAGPRSSSGRKTRMGSSCQARASRSTSTRSLVTRRTSRSTTGARTTRPTTTTDSSASTT